MVYFHCMNLMNLITNQDPIGGLVISDSFVRAAFAAPTQYLKLDAPLICVEEPLPKGAIVDGIIQDSAAFEKALETILTKTTTTYFIVSVSPAIIYSKVLTFPKSVRDEQLSEAIDVAMNFQMPFESGATYSDSEILRDERGRVVHAVAARTTVVDAYLSSLQKVGINTVAMESFAASAARVIRVLPETIILPIPCDASVAISIIKSGRVQFLRSLPSSQLSSPDALDKEVHRMSDAYSAENNVPVQSFTWEKIEPEPTFARIFPPNEPVYQWVIAVGAYMRGTLPREFDSIASILPISTTRAYEQQKAVAFTAFVRNIILSVSFFFVLVYGLFFLFTHTLRERTADEGAIAAPNTTGAAVIEQNAENFGATVDVAADITRQSPTWSVIIDQLLSYTPDGITISSWNVTSPRDIIQFAGMARSRDELNNYRTALESSGVYTHVTMPITNLEMSANIPFNITLQLADPSTAYANK